MHLLHLEDSAADAVLSASVINREWPACKIQRVSTASEYREALDRGGFDLILSDYSLPGFDGLSALAMARVRFPATPFLFLSGTIGEERAVEALKHGATDYILKDRPARLVPAIRQAIASIAESERRRRTEATVPEDEGPVRRISAVGDELVALIDLNACRVYSNAAYGELLGEAAVLSGGDAFADVHPEDVGRVRGVFAQVLEAEATRRFGYRLLLRDGSVREVETHASVLRDATAKIVNVLLVSRDVTARREADARAREQISLLDHACDAIVATDIDHRIAYWNASAERLYGWKAGEVLGRQLNRIELAYSSNRFAEAQAQLLMAGEYQGEFSLRTKAGEHVLVESTWSLVVGEDDRPRSILHIDRDVTHRRKMEALAQRAQRIESLGSLAGGVAHDLNNALTPILLSIDLLAASAKTKENQWLLEQSRAGATRGAEAVQKLRTFAGGAPAARTRIDPKTALASLQPLLQQGLPRTIHLSLAEAGPTWPIQAGATQFEEVLTQLCLNARDAMPQGGRMEIATQNVTVGVALAAANPGTQPGPFVRISVKDTGTGIAPVVIGKIFDPFFTTKGQGKGIGLGLSMVAGILKSHGGFVEVESEPGRGSRFHLFFPAVVRPAPQEGDVSQPTGWGEGEGILLIEDEPAVRDTLQMLLERSGYRVFAAGDGQAGLLHFDRHRAGIALVITDMMLPDQVGTDVIRSLREQSPLIPIIAMSALMDSGRFDALLDVTPAVERLAKPFLPATVLGAVRRGLAATRNLAPSGTAGATAMPAAQSSPGNARVD